MFDIVGGVIALVPRSARVDELIFVNVSQSIRWEDAAVGHLPK
jgi:hypothetical protein